jgi:ATP-dependent RNA helicase SUPV3L1/SUV3
VGALDLFHPAMLKARPLAIWQEARDGSAPVADPMAPVVPITGKAAPLGYRRLGAQGIRLDRAEMLLRDAHALRMAAGKKPFALDPAVATRIGLSTKAYAHLLRQAGFHPIMPRALAQGCFGPPAPLVWRWQPLRTGQPAPAPAPQDRASPFAALARLVA